MGNEQESREVFWKNMLITNACFGNQGYDIHGEVAMLCSVNIFHVPLYVFCLADICFDQWQIVRTLGLDSINYIPLEHLVWYSSKHPCTISVLVNGRLCKPLVWMVMYIIYLGVCTLTCHIYIFFQRVFII